MTNAQLPLEVDADDLVAISGSGKTIAYIDVRTPMEVMQMPAGQMPNIPLNMLPSQFDQLPRADHLVIVCAHGNRSLMAAHWLRQNGIQSAQSLRGGMASWRRFEELAA